MLGLCIMLGSLFLSLCNLVFALWVAFTRRLSPMAQMYLAHGVHVVNVVLMAIFVTARCFLAV